MATGGIFLGGFAKGLRELQEEERLDRQLGLREQALKDNRFFRTQDIDLRRDTLEQQGEFRERGLGLQARGLDLRAEELAHNRTMQERRLGLDEQRVGFEGERLGLARDRLKHEQTLADHERGSELLSGTVEVASNFIKSAREAGRSQESIQRGLRPLLEDIDEVAGMIGRDPSRIRRQLAVMANAPTGEEAATAEARGEVAGAQTLAEEAGLEGEEATQAVQRNLDLVEDSDDLSRLEQERNLLMASNLGQPPDQLTPQQMAAGIAGGRFVTSINPSNGQREIVDLANVSRRTSVAPTQAAGQGGGEAGDIRPEEAVPELLRDPDIDVTEGVGTRGFLKNAVNTLNDFLGRGADVTFDEALDAESLLNSLRVTATAMLQSTVPGRPNKFLLEQIDKINVKPNSILQGEARTFRRLSDIRGLLAQEVGRMQREVLDQRDQWKPSEVQAVREKSSQLRTLMQVYTRLIDNFGGGGSASDRPSLEAFEGGGGEDGDAD